MKFEKVKPGMVLLDIHSHRAGNTMKRELGLWKVVVDSVDSETRTAMCRWNDNKPTRYTEKMLIGLKLKPTKAYVVQEERRRQRGGRMI